MHQHVGKVKLIKMYRIKIIEKVNHMKTVKVYPIKILLTFTSSKYWSTSVHAPPTTPTLNEVTRFMNVSYSSGQNLRKR